MCTYQEGKKNAQETKKFHRLTLKVNALIYTCTFITIQYRDRRVERKSHWPEALFRRLATLHFSNFVPLEICPIRNA